MAVTKAERDLERANLSAVPGRVFFASVVSFFIGTRVISADFMSLGFAGLAAVLALLAVVLKVIALRNGSGRAAAVHRASLAAYIAAVVGAVLIAVDFAKDVGLTPDATSNPPAVPEVSLAPLALIAGLILLCSAVAAVVAIELSCSPMRAAGYAEPRRVLQGVATALTLALAVASVMLFNFAAKSRDIRADYSAAAPTKLSDATIGMVQAAEKPVEIFLFFEKGSAMLPEFLDVYAPLKAAGASLTVLDHALDPELATALKVSRSGTIGFRVGDRTEKWFVGKGRDAVERKLRRADEETRTRLSRITRDAKRLYFTVGHGERKDRKAGKGERLGTENFRKIARALNVSMSKLGFTEGLGRDIPDDASVVVIFGPTKPFLAEEQDSLMRYLERGGSVAIFLDPFVDAGLEQLLTKMQLKMSTTEVVNDKEFIRRSHTSADHAIIFANNFASHRTTRELKKAGGRAAVLFLSAGSLERNKSGDAKTFGDGPPRVTMTMRSRASSFQDKKRNRVFDEALEKRKVLNFGAAYEQKIDLDSSARAVVVSDSDAFADGLIPNDANQAFAYQALAWLVRDDRISGALDLEADVPIRHTEEEDTFVFYGTTAAMPLAVASFGILLLQRRRSRRRTKAGAT